MKRRAQIRVCMLYDFKQGKQAKESHETICKAFGEDVISLRQYQHWFKCFRDGDEALEDEDHNRRPTVVDLDQLKKIIESDPTLTSYELGEFFEFDHSTISRHLDDLGKTNRQGKWVPHLLSDDNKAAGVTIAGILCRKAKRSGFRDITIYQTKILSNK